MTQYLLGDTDGAAGATASPIASRATYAKVRDRSFRTQFMAWEKPAKEGPPDKMFFTLHGIEEPSPPIDVRMRLVVRH